MPRAGAEGAGPAGRGPRTLAAHERRKEDSGPILEKKGEKNVPRGGEESESEGRGEPERARKEKEAANQSIPPACWVPRTPSPTPPLPQPHGTNRGLGMSPP